MSVTDIIITAIQNIRNWPKRKLLQALLLLKEKYLDAEKLIQELQTEIDRLKKEIEDRKMKDVNIETNKPSSKKNDWDKGVGNDGKRKKRGHKPRKGAGNKKKNLKPTQKEMVAVCQCDKCGKDLTDEKPLKSTNKRITVDIPEPIAEAVATESILEKKWCDNCKTVVTARTELALPKSDIGLNANITIIYFWVASCLSLPRISEYLKVFLGLKITTAGLSRMVIRIAGIMKDVYQEILEDVRNAGVLHGDETGWRVKGKNWWLWVFGSADAAFFTIFNSRGSDVVRQVLGNTFAGVLVVDGWTAYLKIICVQQSCLAHLLRKIRDFRKKFPELIPVSKFYIKFRRIIRDGERLKLNRNEIGEEVFRRRLERLKERLSELLEWPNPNKILAVIIDKVKRQSPRILTFVEYPDVPSHNNFAEYLIRIGVLKRKVSGGSLSEEGATAYAMLLSIYVTCNLRGISFPDFMRVSLRHFIRTGKPMLLKSYAEMKALEKAA